MRYCNSQDVESYYLGKEFKCEDYVTSSEIEAFIISESAVINGVLRAKYSLPITDADDLQILKMICEKLVVGTVDDIFREKKIESDFDRTRNPRKEAKEYLSKIADGTMALNSSGLASVMMFNTTDSQGNTVEKRYGDANIEPSNNYVNREHRTTERYY